MLHLLCCHCATGSYCDRYCANYCATKDASGQVADMTDSCRSRGWAVSSVNLIVGRLFFELSRHRNAELQITIRCYRAQISVV